MAKPIRRALISVSDKTGLVEFGKFLADKDVEILSTGGSAKALRDAGVPVTEVSDHTGFPEIMDGRVKTLQPSIHGGLLAIRGNADHEKAMADHNIDPIDLLAVNLYPFEETVDKDADFDTCIENIDIGNDSRRGKEPRLCHRRRRPRRLRLGDGGNGGSRRSNHRWLPP